MVLFINYNNCLELNNFVNFRKKLTLEVISTNYFYSLFLDLPLILMKIYTDIVHYQYSYISLSNS